MLDQLLGSLPRWLFVLIALIAGVVFIVLTNPPHSVCDSQVEIFQELQKGFLYPDPKVKASTPEVVRYGAMCKMGNSPGACFELFSNMRKLIRDLSGQQPECRQKVASVEPVPDILKKVLALMVKIAWGEHPPQSSLDRNGWFDTSHIELFCKLQKWVQIQAGESDFLNLREQIMQSLPEANTLSRQDMWARVLFSVPCAEYR